MYYINSRGNVYQCPPSDPILGDRPATQTEIDTYLLSQTRQTQLDLINSGFRNQAYGLVVFKNTTFQADEESRARLLATLSAYTAITLPVNFFWVDSLNNQVPMTYIELQSLLNVGANQFFAAFQHLQTQKTAINNAATIAQIQAIIW